MPRISYFLGISIYMFYGDHNPAHFHAIYGEHRAVIMVETGEVLGGGLPPRALRLVEEWLSQQRVRLLEDWDLARNRLPLKPIPPLE